MIFARGDTISEVEFNIVKSFNERAKDMSDSDKSTVMSNLMDSSSDNQLNAYIRSQILKNKFYYAAITLRDSPGKLDQMTRNMLADYLITNDKKPVGRPPKQREHNEIMADYFNMIEDGKKNDIAKRFVCKKYGVTDANFRQIMSRYGSKFK
jgi:predicted transcriptional regulator